MPGRAGAHKEVVPKGIGECLTGGHTWRGAEGREQSDCDGWGGGGLTMLQPGPGGERACSEEREAIRLATVWEAVGDASCVGQ